MMVQLKKALPAVISGLIYLATTTAYATSFNQVVIFGDSLSDGGNVALYFDQTQSRYTTNPGKTAAELVALGLGHQVAPSVIGGSNYAWGGAGVVNSLQPELPTLTQQLAFYLNSTQGTADADTLYQVWGGANDIFGLIQTPGINAAQLMSGTVTAAKTELGLLSALHAAGAKYAVVYNLPNMGLTPSALTQGEPVSGYLTQLSGLYNLSLSQGLDHLSSSGLNIVPVNVYGLLNEVIADPSVYGFANVTNEACGVGSSALECGPEGSGAKYTYAAGTNNSYLFADGVHPTTATHQLLAQSVLAELAAPRQMTLLAEVPLSITRAQYRAIKNEMLNDMNGQETRFFMNVDYNHQKLKASATSPALSNHNVNVTAGSSMQLNDQVSAGVGVSLDQQNGDIAATGKYSLFDASALGYALYHKNGIYLGGFANLGSLHFNKIKRRIQLRNMTRVERADTQGYHFGGGLHGGYWFNLADVKTGPFVHAEWQTIKLNNFAENGLASTAMWFAEQQRNSFVTSIGWRLKGDWDYKKVRFSPFAELAWNHDFQADPLSVRAGLNTMGGSFVMTGYAPEKDWGFASLGLTTQYANNMSTWFSVNTDFAYSHADNLGLNLGMKYAF